MEGDTVLAEAVDAYQLALLDRLLAAYALGSLAHGGFSELVSDVDLGLIVSGPIRSDDTARIETVAEVERVKGSDLHARLSVFWGTPSTLRGEESGGRFPALDRLDLIENGRLLAGKDNRDGISRPSPEELLVSGAEFALDYLAGVRPSVTVDSDALASMDLARQDAVLSPRLLVDQGVRRVTKLVLFPTRFLYTATTGQVGTNDAAADRYLADHEAPGKELVAAARAWRTGMEFSEAAARDLLGQQLVPLYLYYIDDHIARLDALRQEQLSAYFRRWREQLRR